MSVSSDTTVSEIVGHSGSAPDNIAAIDVTAGKSADTPTAGLLDRYGAWAFAVGILLIYLPIVWDAGQDWFADPLMAHGVFIIPVALFLLYIRRDQIRGARVAPVAWGLVPLVFGLSVATGAYIMRIHILDMWSIIPTLIGAVLVLHGNELLKICRFPILFLAFAAPMPTALVNPASHFVKETSTTGAVAIVQGLGYTVLQSGNSIRIPGYELEVADVCSGFKKTVALVAFSLLFGHLFDIKPWKRWALLAAAVPIAVLANVVRVAALVMVTSAGGLRALHIAHDWAEIIVLVVAFVLFVLLGKVLGCKTLRYAW